MEVLENIYAVLGITLLLLLVPAFIVAAFLPTERRRQLLQRLCRVQF